MLQYCPLPAYPVTSTPLPAMKRIDLTCLIASPIAVGLVMTFGGREPMAAATLALVAWNMVAWVPECWLLSFAQRRSAALQQPKGLAADGKAASAGGGRSWWRHLGSWRAYFEQPVAPAALALALLYFTVLSFGSLMTAYLAWLGMPEAELSVYRG